MESFKDEYADGTVRPKGFEYFIEYDSVTEKYKRLVEHSLVCDTKPYPQDIVCIGFELFGAHQLNITTKVGDIPWRSLDKQQVDDLITALIYYRQRMEELSHQ